MRSDQKLLKTHRQERAIGMNDTPYSVGNDGQPHVSASTNLLHALLHLIAYQRDRGTGVTGNRCLTITSLSLRTGLRLRWQNGD
ncbi:hypothetical protein NQZ68_032719 [Dissostichus eleginoides]|nr:hypothetical protein NQZ68_032719 [Dissostichus eleginoides]